MYKQQITNKLQITMTKGSKALGFGIWDLGFVNLLKGVN